MRIVYFTHSLRSCWNHGNAHFLRGVLRALLARGHDVTVYEPANGWSLQNLRADHGPRGLDAFRAAYPELSSHAFGPDFDPASACDGADLVIVHEWNEPALVAAIGAALDRIGQPDVAVLAGDLPFIGPALAELQRCVTAGPSSAHEGASQARSAEERSGPCGSR